MGNLVLFLTLVLVSSSASAQHDVTGGGDPLMLIFEKAKDDAASMLSNIGKTGLDDDIDEKARLWLLAPDLLSGLPRYEAMALDVKASKHHWQVGDVFNDRCAATNFPPSIENPGVLLSDVFLSLSRCRSVLLATMTGDAEAVRTLLHEASHHFGVGTSDTEESFGSLVANVIYNTWLRDRLTSLPNWQEITAVGGPEERSAHSFVWTGQAKDPDLRNRLILWGGCNQRLLPPPESCARYLNSGGQLQLRRSHDGSAPSMTWLSMNASVAPAARAKHTAIFTGQSDYAGIADRMIVFGGCRGKEFGCVQSLAVTACTSGAADCDELNKNHIIYDPKSDAWTPATAFGAPSPRVQHTAIWTGIEMLVWGGLQGLDNPQPDTSLGDGGALRFSDEYPLGHWRMLPSEHAPAPRFGHTAIWTGKQMVIWGGCLKAGFSQRCLDAASDGAAYAPPMTFIGADSGSDPQTQDETWNPLPAVPFLAGRTDHSAVWTGRYMIIWGGQNATGVLSDGALLDTEAIPPKWIQISGQLPHNELGRTRHSAAWDGLRGRMIVWGGQDASGDYPTTTLVFDPSLTPTGTWSIVSTPTAPMGRVGQAAAWIFDSLMVWGGYGRDGAFLRSGGLFNP